MEYSSKLVSKFLKFNIFSIPNCSLFVHPVVDFGEALFGRVTTHRQNSLRDPFMLECSYAPGVTIMEESCDLCFQRFFYTTSFEHSFFSLEE